MKNLRNILSALFVMILGVCNANAQNNLTISNIDIKPGESVTLPVMMNNSDNIIAFQFSISLSEGLTIAKEMNEDDELAYCVELTSRKKSDHTISCGDPVNGVYTIAAFSATNKTFRDNSGAICNIKLNVASDIDLKNVVIKLTNIELANSNNEPIHPEDVATAITSVKNDAADATIYDITGRVSNGTKSGLYIKNNKKYIVR